MARRVIMRLALAALVAAIAVVSAGCGAVAHMTATSGDPARGAPLFKSNCGGCHTLAAAGTTGTIGPNLDDAFGPVRTCQGFKNVESTIRDLVRGQIAYADSDPDQAPVSPGASTQGMPANILRGQQAKDVAAYVASVAGVHWSCQNGSEGT
jgi:mono/diheme cytochrome c family protein